MTHYEFSDDWREDKIPTPPSYIEYFWRTLKKLEINGVKETYWCPTHARQEAA